MVILCISMWKCGYTVYHYVETFCDMYTYNKGECINKCMIKFVGIIEEKQRIYNQTYKEIINLEAEGL